MKKWIIALALVLLTGCAREEAVQTRPPETVAHTTAAPTTVPETTVPETTVPEETLSPVVLELTEEEQEILLKIGMAELGDTQCETCIALVMRTVINRVESGRFSKSIYGVLHAQDQFTPVMDGTYDRAVPNEACYDALDLVLRGWDESQGALYYEFCEGESWHSQNLTLLTSHCNTRFYR